MSDGREISLQTPATSHDEAGVGEQLGTISREVVKLLRETVGRGPTRCKTSFAGSEMLVIVLSGGYLPAEHTLQEAGHNSEVMAMRSALQTVLEERLRETVERNLGRQVVAFMSTSHADPDLMVELFALAPSERP